MLIHYEGARDEGNASVPTFCWYSGLFDKCVLSLHKMLMIVLNILSTVR